VQELSKGKITTLPAGHTGEGVFFTSKAVRIFEMSSSGLRWIVDNVRGDMAVGDSHSETKIEAVAMSAPVAFLVRRATGVGQV
jgi:hypothetical protein